MTSTLTAPGIDELAPFTSSGASRVAAAIVALSTGEMVMLGEEQRCNLVLTGSLAGTNSLARMVKDGTGIVFASLPRRRLAELGIPPMPSDAESRCSDFHIAVDASAGIGTGISAIDRARTIRLLSDTESVPADFIRPGHVIPIAGDMMPSRAPSTAQLALALATLSNPRFPCAAYSALTSPTDPCQIAGMAEGEQIATDRGMPFITRDDVLSAFYR